MLLIKVIVYFMYYIQWVINLKNILINKVIFC